MPSDDKTSIAGHRGHLVHDVDFPCDKRRKCSLNIHLCSFQQWCGIGFSAVVSGGGGGGCGITGWIEAHQGGGVDADITSLFTTA
jgi:hypothetical protein